METFAMYLQFALVKVVMDGRVQTLATSENNTMGLDRRCWRIQVFGVGRGTAWYASARSTFQRWVLGWACKREYLQPVRAIKLLVAQNAYVYNDRR